MGRHVRRTEGVSDSRRELARPHLSILLVLEKLNKRAVELYLKGRPEAEWERTPEDEEILRKSKENSEGMAKRFFESGFQLRRSSVGEGDSEDLIEMQTQAYVTYIRLLAYT